MAQSLESTAYDFLNTDIQRRIGFRVARLARRYRLSRPDREDLRQEFCLAMVHAGHRFNPDRGTPVLFATSVLNRCYRHFLRKLTRAKEGRAQSVNAVSMEACDAEWDRLLVDPKGEDDHRHVEIREDVESVIAGLPEDLATICRDLMWMSVPQVARKRGVHHSTIYRAIPKLREHFINAGFEDVFSASRAKKRRAKQKDKGRGRNFMKNVETDQVHVDLAVLEVESADQYHAKAAEYLSSHQLLDFMRCPYLHAKKRAGLIAENESPAYLIGRAAHCRILEGREVYQSQFALGGPINPSTGRPYGSTTKKFAEWQAQQGKPVLSHEQADLIEKMAAGVALSDAAVDLLLYGRAEGVVRAQYCDVPCQIRIDWTHPHRGIVDLKTCDDLTWFESDARRYRYHHQMAFYRAVLAEVVGQDVPVHVVAVEKKEPFRCGVWRVSDDTLAIARAVRLSNPT